MSRGWPARLRDNAQSERIFVETVIRCNRRAHLSDLVEDFPVTSLCGSEIVRSSKEAHLKQLFVSGLDGDRLAYRAFLQDLTELMRGYVRRKLGRVGCGDGDIEDIVQDVMIAIHERRHTYRREVPVTAWAHAIARYKLIDFFRATTTARRHLPLEAAANCIGDDATRIEVAFIVRRLLATLPERFRKPIELTRLHGLSVTEAAKATGMSEAAVKVNIHRGIKSLSRLIGGSR
ncbi:MAG: sigma-70 family RNA polymerase sigma factor [Xanthobacteraceae bacterium]